MRALRLPIAVLTALLLAPAAAQSAVPDVVVSTTGTSPSAAIDPTGTTFVAYKATGVDNAIGFCRVVFRGTACDPTAIAPPLPGVDPAAATVQRVFLRRRAADGALVLVSSVFEVRSDQPDAYTVWASVSPDAGATWSPQVPIGTGQQTLAEVSLTPDGQALNAISDTSGSADFSRLPVAGPPAPVARDLKPPTDGGVGASTLVTQPDGSVVAGFAFNNRFGLSRLPAGADPVGGWTAWTRAGRIRASESGQRFAAGVRGTFLLARRFVVTQIRRSKSPALLRVVGSSKVGKGTRVGRGRTLATPGFAQDPVGGLHVAFFDTGSKSVVYTRSRGARGRCSFEGQARQRRVASPSRQPEALELVAAAPKTAAIVWEEDDDPVVHLVFPKGGDTPKPPAKRKC